MDSFSPHNLFHCLNHPLAAWLTICLSVGVFIWFFIIALIPWRRAIRNNVGHGRKAMREMMHIFMICSITGYASLSLAGWYPKEAYILRIVGLAILNVACPMFLYWVRGKKFDVVSKHMRFGVAAEAILDMVDTHDDPADVEARKILFDLREVRQRILSE